MSGRRRRNSVPPLRPRDGLAAARVRMPLDGAHPSVLRFLVEVTGDEQGVRRRVAAGEVRLGDATVVTADTAYQPGGAAYLYRDLPTEVPVPVTIPVLHRDEHLVVIDKPPFLATTPRGRHVRETVLVRLRQELGLPDLQPVHRLDRLTSGVLVLAVRAGERGAYQSMVAAGGLHKTYEALAPVREELAAPVTVRSRILKERGRLQAIEVHGEPNAETRVELVGRLAGLGHYRLTPATGRTHQLRVQLAGLGIPIDGDPLYPQVRDVAADDFTCPLQLLASDVRFTDPVTGEPRRWASRRSLPERGLTGCETLER